MPKFTDLCIKDAKLYICVGDADTYAGSFSEIDLTHQESEIEANVETGGSGTGRGWVPENGALEDILVEYINGDIDTTINLFLEGELGGEEVRLVNVKLWSHPYALEASDAEFELTYGGVE